MEATSLSQVCGFMATIRSVPPRAPRWPASETRTSYHVGSPWMLEGKILRGATGTPMRITARANISFALAEPDPFTLAKRITKSFTRLIGEVVGMKYLRKSYRARISAYPRHRSDNVRRTGRNAGRRPRP